MQTKRFVAELARLIFASLVEVILVVAIASPDWMACRIAGETSNATNEAKIGLWTRNVTGDEAVYFMMTGLRPISMLWLVVSTAVVVGCVVNLANRRRRSCPWMETMIRTLIACEGVTILTFVGASLLNFRLIKRIHDCHAVWDYWVMYFAAGFYVKKGLCALYMTISDLRESQGGGDTAAIVDAEVENQGAEDIAIEAENQANGDTTATATAATEAENQGNEDTTTTASATTEGQENQEDEHT